MSGLTSQPSMGAVCMALEHQQPCKFSDGLRSDIFRHFQKFSEIFRPAVGQLFRTTFSDTSQAVTQTFLDWQSSRHLDYQKYVSFFQLISFAYIQTVRKCQLFSVQQLDGQKHVSDFQFDSLVVTQNIRVFQHSSCQVSLHIRLPVILRYYQSFSVCQLI